ncbi:MAG: hypothetical protein K9J74_04990 [Sulfuritalea sp.]|nr:hypothetical protein [Sulfuritalea sp.]
MRRIARADFLDSLNAGLHQHRSGGFPGRKLGHRNYAKKPSARLLILEDHF